MEKESLIVQSVLNGNKASFKELVDLHKRNVYNLAYNITGNREDAEDVTQEVFIRAYGSLQSFRGESKFSTWLYRITVNRCCSIKSKKSYTAMKIHENMEDLMKIRGENREIFPSPERSTEAGFFRECLEKALQQLSEKERIVFIMRNLSELSFGEIVDIMKVKSSTVRSLNLRALRKLRQELAFYDPKI